MPVVYSVTPFEVLANELPARHVFLYCVVESVKLSTESEELILCFSGDVWCVAPQCCDLAVLVSQKSWVGVGECSAVYRYDGIPRIRSHTIT